MDVGYRHPTACLWVAAVPAGFDLGDGRTTESPSLIVYREHYRREWTVKEHV